MPGTLEDLVVSCLRRIDRQGPEAIQQMCAEHPEHARALRAQISALRSAGLLPECGAAMPEQLGRFRLRARLGGGGMGMVYLAEDTALGRLVACKVIRPELLLIDGARDRFRREVESVARLQHGSIVPVIEFGEDHGVPFLIMPRIEGCTLAQALEWLRGRDPSRLAATDLRDAVHACAIASEPPGDGVARAGWGRSWSEACARLIAQVALALDHAHERGVLHRDVKPSNIMVTADGRALLLDFGLARADDATRITRSGAEVGSLPYMAPEQLRGDLTALDRRTDVYAAGVTLYEMLSLQLPFDGDMAEATRRSILEGTPRPLRRHNRAVGWELEIICATAMDPEPSSRYATAAALARDLENALADRPIIARRPGALRRLRRWLRRHPVVAASLLAAAAALVVASLLFGIRQRTLQRELRAQLALGRQLATTMLGVSRSMTRTMLPSKENLALLASMGELIARLESAGGDTTEYLELVADWRRQLGEGEVRSGSVEDAAAHFEARLALCEELLRRHPRDPERTAELSIALVQVGDTRRSAGQSGDARHLYERALVIDEGLVNAHPDNAHYLDNRAWSYNRLGHDAWASGERLRGCVLYARQHAAMRRAWSLEPEVGDRVYGMCSAHVLAMRALGYLEAPLAERRPFAEAATALARKLEQRWPAHPLYMAFVSEVYLACESCCEGDAERALRYRSDAVRLARRLAESGDPALDRGELCGRLLDLAGRELGRGDIVRAGSHLGEARAALEALAARGGVPPAALAERWCDVESCAAEVEMACGRRVTAAAHWQRALDHARDVAPAGTPKRAHVIARLVWTAAATAGEQAELERFLDRLARPQAGDESHRLLELASLYQAMGREREANEARERRRALPAVRRCLEEVRRILREHDPAAEHR